MVKLPSVRVVELPFAVGSAFDRALGAKSSGRVFDVPRLRHEWREALGVSPLELSLGRRGKVALELKPVLNCTQTARRWSSDFAGILRKSYLEHGLPKVVVGDAARSTFARLPALIQDRVKVSQPDRAELAAFIVTSMLDLFRTDAEFQALAEAVGAVEQDVDAELSEMRRVSGVIERFEGDGDGEVAVTAERIGEQEVVFVRPASFFRELGMNRAGTPYIRTILAWSSDNEASVFVPALRFESPESKAFMNALDEAATPLPPAPDRWPRLKRV